MEAVMQACIAATRGTKVSKGILTTCAGVRVNEGLAEIGVVKQVQEGPVHRVTRLQY